jgi:hypothetical protein
MMQRVSSGLPGHEVVDAGICDLAAGRDTEPAFLVAIAAPRLRALGIEVPAGGGEQPDHSLYELLSERDPGDAHSRYNALIRQMVSFCRAAEHATTS